MQIQNNLRSEKCPLCGSVVIQKIGNIQLFSPTYYSTEIVSMVSLPELWKCCTCDSAFVQNAVPEETSVALYTQGKSNQKYAKINTEQPKTQVVSQTLDMLFQKDLRILDVGCNTGELLDFGKNKGCKTFGVEYSQDSLILLKKKGHVAYSNIKEIEGLFDIITAFDLIEHLYNLNDFLDTCFNVLSPGGCLIFLTGDISCFWAKLTRANWWYVRYPEHITFPSKKYFELHPKFQIVDWIPTYADRVYDRPKFRVLMSIAKRLLLGDYSGLPALSSDHALIILKRRNF